MVVLSDQRFTCCFCLHVRTGTIILGFGQIIVHLLCISVMLLMTMRPDLLQEIGNPLGEHVGMENTSVGKMDSRAHFLSFILRILPGVTDMQESLAVHRTSRLNKPMSEGSNGLGLLSLDDSGHGHIVQRGGGGAVDTVNEPNDYNNPSDAQMHLYNDDSHRNSVNNRRFSPYFSLCLSLFSLAFCCFLVHGAITRQPTHLLPFFFLQVFDFIIYLLTVVNYMSATTNFRLLLHTKNGTVYVNSTGLTFVILSISCIMLAVKAYCLGIVWDCYKYLMLTNQTGGMVGSWGRERFSFLPTIWSFMGVGRPSMLSRRRNNLSGVAGSEHHTDGVLDDLTTLPPATYNQSSDLPNYDDALKIPANAYAPPPYFKPGGKNKSGVIQPPVPAVSDAERSDSQSNGIEHPPTQTIRDNQGDATNGSSTAPSNPQTKTVSMCRWQMYLQAEKSRVSDHGLRQPPLATDIPLAYFV